MFFFAYASKENRTIVKAIFRFSFLPKQKPVFYLSNFKPGLCDRTS